jgi:diguanylate cyclase (GGDEF)-like protein
LLRLDVSFAILFSFGVGIRSGGGEVALVIRNLFAHGSPATTFSTAEIAIIFEAGELVFVEAGTRILSRGEPGDSMFVLLSGSVQVELPTVNRVMAERGSYFGELSFIGPMHSRSATISALTDCKLCRLDQRSMAILEARSPHVLITLMRRTCSVMVNTEESLAAQLRLKNRELEGTLDYLRRTREELDQQELLAQTDELTGLYNRRCFQVQINRFIERSEETDEGLALIFMDLDHFKPINDSLGHAAGDAVLVGVGAILRAQVRRTDLPVRLGGDEFAVALVDVTAEQAMARANSIRRAVRDLKHPGTPLGMMVTCSMGGTLYQLGEPTEALMERADKALYEAKAMGRDAVSWR